MQSNELQDDTSTIAVPEFAKMAHQDIGECVDKSVQSIVQTMFPDEAFGFPINANFMGQLKGTFLMTQSSLLTSENITKEKKAAPYLNQMITTIEQFLQDAHISHLQPLRYFTSVHADTPIQDDMIQRKPDIVLVRLIDGCTRNNPIYWRDVQALFETTSEKKPSPQMRDTINNKVLPVFGEQPERDFTISVAITSEGFHVVQTDHVGHVVSDELYCFHNDVGTKDFVRLVMGLAFLPDEWIGVDTTIIRRELGVSSNKSLIAEFPPFETKRPLPVHISELKPCDGPGHVFNNKRSSPLVPSAEFIAITRDPAPEGYDTHFSVIKVGDTHYPVIKHFLRSQTLIGRATRVFLVEAPGGVEAVLKDSWVLTQRPVEARTMQQFTIPYGPELVNDCILAKTDERQESLLVQVTTEAREKRRIVMTPAGVHISDFSSCWELLVLDVVVSIMYLENNLMVHRDISYTNIMLCSPGEVSETKASIHQDYVELLGLASIHKMRLNLGCREGLLIDLDYVSQLSILAEEPSSPSSILLNSGVRTGTPPFMAIELLICRCGHCVVHDLESLFLTLLFICTHLKGPGCQVSNPPLYGPGSHAHPSQMKDWLTQSSLTQLGYLKMAHMMVCFETAILPHISPYFQPIVPYLQEMWLALYPRRPQAGFKAIHSIATCTDFIRALKHALQDKNLQQAAENISSSSGRSVLGKCTASVMLANN